MYENLLEWTKEYIKYRDLVRREISSVNTKENKLIVLLKSGNSLTYVCQNSLDNIIATDLTNERIVCLNSRKNVDWLIKNWDVIKSTKTLFIFVNLIVSQNWAVNPALHNSVIERKALATGLKSLFDSIPEVM